MPFNIQRSRVLWFSLAIMTLPTAVTVAEDVVGFDQVKPILRKRCVTCHNPDELRGELDLKELTAIRAGSASGDVVVAGDPSASMLYTTLAHLEDPVMPPNSPQIPAREQDIIRRWIEGGLAERTGPKVVNEAAMGTGSATADSTAESTASSNGSAARSIGSEANEEVEGLVAIGALPQAAAFTALDAHPTLDLAAVNGLQQAVLFKPSTREWLSAINIPQGDVSDLRFSRDGKLLMVAAGQAAVSGTVTAFEVETGKRVWQVADETDSILTFDLSRDGKMLAVGGPSKTVRIYEVPSGREMHALKKHTDWILRVRFSPDGLLLASSDRFGGIFVWEPIQGTVFHGLKDHAGAAHAIAWDEDSETLISGGEDGKLRTWNLHHGELTSSWDAQVGAILDVARGSGFIAAAGRSGKVAAWSSPETLVAGYELNDQAERLSRTADGKLLIVGDSRGQASIMKSDTLEQVASLSLPTSSSAMQQLLVRLDKAEQRYTEQLKSSELKPIAKGMKQEQVADSAATRKEAPKADVAVREASNSSPKAQVTSELNRELNSELEANRLQVAEVEALLQQSNRVLSSLAKNNEQLVELLKQSSDAQAELAQQISQQARMLASLRARMQQLEEAAAK